MRDQIVAALEASLTMKVWYLFGTDVEYRFKQLEQVPFTTTLWVRLTDEYGNDVGLSLEALCECKWDWDYL